MTSHSPGDQGFLVDEFIDRPATKLPAAAQLRDGQPGRAGAAAEPRVTRHARRRFVPSRTRLRRLRWLSPHSCECSVFEPPTTCTASAELNSPRAAVLL